MRFLRNGRFWQAAGFLVILGVALWIPAIGTDEVKDSALFISEDDIEKIEVTSGVRASFYAMVAAAFVLIGLIPTGHRLNQPDWFSLLVQVTGGGSAFFAAWLWLSSETRDMPLPYILPMVILGFVVGLV